MNHKMLFTDLDRTLLCDDKSISMKNRRAVQQMLDDGHYLVLATGRSIEAGRIVVQELGLTNPGCYMIAYNGAVVYDCAADRVLYRRTVPIEVVQELFERAKRAGIYAQTYNSVDVITHRHTKELEYYVKRTHMSYKLTDNIFSTLKEEPPKVLLIRLEDDDKLVRFRRANAAWAEGKCNAFFSCRQYLEYCPLGTDKGTGVKYLVQLLNIPEISTIAVGDEQNDIAMLRAAHVGIAVKNGIEEIKDVADYVTENDNNHDAIAEIIGKFVL